MVNTIDENNLDDQCVAIIGMAGRFPGADDIDSLWDIIANGRDVICRDGKDALSPANLVRARGLLKNIDRFDAGFFGFNPREAAELDPQHRLWLELAHEALEKAGYAHNRHDYLISVFSGCFPSTYLLNNLLPDRKAVEEYVRMRQPQSLSLMVQNDPAFLPTRTAYAFGLKGPAVNVQSACSTSLVAVALAVQNLLTYESDMALAGGACITVPTSNSYFYFEGSISSRDGVCRPYDHQSCGTVFGCGAGVVVLKRLEDAVRDHDPILALIKGTAINNDGNKKVSYYAPSVEGQAEVVKAALSISGIPADTIGYLEGHGTGTPIGDPIEVEALNIAYREQTDKKHYCCLGSIKGNVGHLDAAAGIASLMRAVLALRHKVLPATAHFEKPNPDIDFNDSPFFVNSQTTAWERKDHPRRAAVNSLGVGGTNAHIILEEAPGPVHEKEVDTKTSEPAYLLMSAKNARSLDEYTATLADWMEKETEKGKCRYRLSDVAHTLTERRELFKFRRAVRAENLQDAVVALREPERWATQETVNGKPAIYLAFPGQGNMRAGETARLLKEIPQLLEYLKPLAILASEISGFDFLQWFQHADTHNQELENNNMRAQLAAFCMQASLYHWIEAKGIKADGFLGHSLGEWVAAYAAKVFSPEDAIKAVFHRGQFMQMAGPGAALIVQASAEQIKPYLNEDVSLACENAVHFLLVSGRPEPIEAFATELRNANIANKRAPINVPVHSRHLDEQIEPFRKTLSSVTFSPPERQVLSAVTGNWLGADEIADMDYWSTQMRQPVNFKMAAETLCRKKPFLQIEVGFGTTLTTLVGEAIRDKKQQRLLPLIGPPGQGRYDQLMYRCLGHVWGFGGGIRLVDSVYDGYFAPLPTYCFQRKRYWVEAPESLDEGAIDQAHDCQNFTAENPSEDKNDADICKPRNDFELQVALIFCELLGLKQVDVRDNFFDLGGDSLLAARLLTDLRDKAHQDLSLADIFENPTVESLAKVLSKGGGHLRTAILPLNKGNRKKTIYFVVGINIYRALSEQIDDLAQCYGIFLPAEEALFKEGADLKNWTVNELANAYRQEIERHSQGKPIILAGISFGGVVAYEIARQFEKTGQPVPLLIMLDSLLPSGRKRANVLWVAEQVKSVFRKGPSSIIDKIRKKISPKNKFRKPRAHPEGEGVTDQRLAAYDNAVVRFDTAANESTYKGKTLLVQAGDVNKIPGYRIDHYYGWRKHITGDFKVTEAPGDHLGILSLPNVKIVADAIRQSLQEIPD